MPPILFRPDVTASDREAVEALPPERVPPHGESAPPRPDWAPQPWGLGGRVLVNGTLTVFVGIGTALIVLACLLFVWWPWWAALIPALVLGGFGGAFVLPVIEKLLFPRRNEPANVRDYRNWETAVRLCDAFVVTDRLRADFRDLVRRADDSVHEVLASQAHARGLLDTARDATELPERVWRIAFDLAALQKPMDLLADAERDVSSAEGRAALRQRRKPLGEAHRGLVARVEVLEAYARRVREVDTALAESEALARLGADNSGVDALSRIAGSAAAYPREADAGRDMDSQAALNGALEAARAAARGLG
ncbi:hypothetical protein [Streptomyces sp. NPDC003077]|uniref:hypothetical protein n=1 Tax=Streptomyces sp. NPDC003077 TaxID=3154443 RepID=UPI0033A31DB0